jgi:GTPase
MFLDEAVVELVSGRGGAGSASFHREKHVPRGGPNGADGGRGGNVILIADRHKRTLYDFKLQRRFEAESGTDAHTNKTGRDGKDIEIRVPVGTIIWDDELNEPIVDLAADGMRYVVCKGGRGGFGNLHYTSSVRQAPTIAQKGAPGDELRARLELKLLADVGLIGLPNAGKSTLISRISAAKPKIADYPFTTIVPNLGVVVVGHESFTVADMPGLIEGASEGRGLGHQFLRHVERTRVLIHVLDGFPIDGSDPVKNYQVIEAELKQYSEEIFNRPRLLALTKMDIGQPGDDEVLIEFLREVTGPDLPIFPISAVSGIGLEPLLRATLEILEREADDLPPIVSPEIKREADDTWDVVRVNNGYRVVGKRVERLVAMTNLGNEESLRYLHRRLGRIGVIKRLEEMGVEEGDTIWIGKLELEYEGDW